MAARPRLALAPGGPRLRLPPEHQSGRELDSGTRPHALGRRDGPKGRSSCRPGLEREDASGDHALPSPEAALARARRLMLAHDLALEGKVPAVAADRGHHFSKPVRDHIVLVVVHVVHGDATPVRSSGTTIWHAAGRTNPISGRST